MNTLSTSTVTKTSEFSAESWYVSPLHPNEEVLTKKFPKKCFPGQAFFYAGPPSDEEALSGCTVDLVEHNGPDWGGGGHVGSSTIVK